MINNKITMPDISPEVTTQRDKSMLSMKTPKFIQELEHLSKPKILSQSRRKETQKLQLKEILLEDDHMNSKVSKLSKDSRPASSRSQRNQLNKLSMP